MHSIASLYHRYPYYRLIGCFMAVYIMALCSGCSSLSGKNQQIPVEKTTQAEAEVNALKQKMLGMIEHSIQQDTRLTQALKADITAEAIAPLREESAIFLTGADKQTRPIAVTFQKAFEQALVELEDQHSPLLVSATAIIHTDMPTTPLCNPPKQVLSGSVGKDMINDPERLRTITDRSITVRKMARCGSNLSLVIAYAKDGLEKRTPAEKAVYLEETLKPDNCNLVDARLQCDAVPAEISGSSYILTTPSGGQLYFGNNGMQALESGKNMYWRYWFGNTQKIVPGKRKLEVEQFLKNSGFKKISNL